jgi:hypothetical protein
MLIFFVFVKLLSLMTTLVSGSPIIQDGKLVGAVDIVQYQQDYQQRPPSEVYG